MEPGELREIVEQQIPSRLFDQLIAEGKARYDGTMVFLPKKVIGETTTFSRLEEGIRSK